MIRRRIQLLVLALAMLGCTNRETDSIRTAREPQRLEVRGMDNAVRVGDLLFGGQPAREALQRLASDGYKTVVSTRGLPELGWDEQALVDSLGMRFETIPMPKPVTTITDEQVQRFAECMENSDRPVVLHCSSGNRVAGLWVVWLVEREGVPAEEAMRLGTAVGMTGIRAVVEARLELGAGESSDRGGSSRPPDGS